MNDITKEILDATTISFVGRKGLGKTFGSAVLINNIDKHTIVLDITGAYSNNDLVRNAKYLIFDVFSFDRNKIIKILSYLKDYKKLVINLSKLTRKEMLNFSEIFFRVVNELGDVGIVIDEVGELVSQQREYYSAELERCCRIGRNYGVKPFIVITQRTQKVDKNILALSDYYIVMGLTHNLDLMAIKELIGLDKKEFENDLMPKIKNLKVGEFYLIKYDGTYRKCKFNLVSNLVEEIQPKGRINKLTKEIEEEEESEVK